MKRSIAIFALIFLAFTPLSAQPIDFENAPNPIKESERNAIANSVESVQ